MDGTDSYLINGLPIKAYYHYFYDNYEDTPDQIQNFHFSRKIAVTDSTDVKHSKMHLMPGFRLNWYHIGGEGMVKFSYDKASVFRR